MFHVGTRYIISCQRMLILGRFPTKIAEATWLAKRRTKRDTKSAEEKQNEEERAESAEEKQE